MADKLAIAVLMVMVVAVAMRGLAAFYGPAQTNDGEHLGPAPVGSPAPIGLPAPVDQAASTEPVSGAGSGTDQGEPSAGVVTGVRGALPATDLQAGVRNSARVDALAGREFREPAADRHAVAGTVVS